MGYKHSIQRYRRWYAKLLRFYSKPFYERFGEGMEQTFSDFLRERAEEGRGLFGSALWMFAETCAGIISENIRRSITMPVRKIIRVLLIAAALLIVPLTASFFVDGWNWGVGGYIFAWIMFSSAGLAYAFVSSDVTISNSGEPIMKRSSTIFLQVVVVLVGIGALAFMLWEPHLEGRNVHSTLFQIYFNDPFLAYAYIASIPFFMALYKAFTLLGYIGQNKIYSLNSVKALRTIKYCAMTIVAFIVVPEAYLFIARPGDDIAGGVAIGFLMIFISLVVVTAAAAFQRTLQSSVDMKSENDVTA